jgi:hypothetical protein
MDLSLHIFINERGERMNLQITKGNTHDTKPIKELVKGLKGYLIRDKGYLLKDTKRRFNERAKPSINYENKKRYEATNHDTSS